MPNLYLEFLPEYSPDYNLIESGWFHTRIEKLGCGGAIAPWCCDVPVAERKNRGNLLSPARSVVSDSDRLGRRYSIRH